MSWMTDSLMGGDAGCPGCGQRPLMPGGETGGPRWVWCQQCGYDSRKGTTMNEQATPADVLREALLPVLVEDAEAGEWGGPPVLYRVHVLDGTPRLVRVELPRWMWAIGGTTPGEVLEMVAYQIRMGGLRPKTSDPEGELVGMAFRQEGQWLLPVGVAGEALGATAVMAGAMPVDLRVVVAVDLHQQTYQALCPKGHTQAIGMATSADHDGIEIAGRAVEALDSMVESLLGVTPRKRRPIPDDTEGQSG